MFNHKSIIVVVFGFKISVWALVAGSSGGPSCPEVKKLNVSEFLLQTSLYSEKPIALFFLLCLQVDIDMDLGIVHVTAAE